MADKSGISELVRKVGTRKASSQPEGSDPSKIFSIIDYIEQPWGLHMKLYPAQRFIVKLYYNIPLDDTIPEDPYRRIQIPDMFKTKILYEFSEKDYLKYLFNEGRCNISEQDHERRELILSIGRRAGKTTLAGVFASYEVYRLLSLHNPQSYFGLPNGNRIQIISVATDKDQAGLLFNEVTTHIAKCDYFKPYLANNTQSFVNFRTPYDIEKFGPTVRHEDGKFVTLNGKATLRLTFKSCIAKGLRGSGNIVVVLDEIAHFQDKGNSSAEEIYNAVTPSTAAFSRKDHVTKRPLIDPVTGQEAPVESRIILISSPLGKSGQFYEKYSIAMRGGEAAHNLLAIQAPTWEVNPTVASSYYRQKYHEDPTNFMVEHGAQFSDQIRGWVEREKDLLDCIDPNLRPKRQAAPRMPHQMGIDIGMMHDGSAISITHIDGDRIILDYHEAWYAGVDWRTTNPHLEGQFSVDYAKTLADVARLDFDEIAKWIVALSRRFHITAGLFDRWNGLPLEQSLFKMGLKQFKSEFFTRDDTSKMYQAAKMLMFDRALVLYDYPVPERTSDGVRHSPLIAELLTLQAEQVSKNIVVVQAPKGKQGAHDDVSDSLARSIWLSIEALTNQKHVSNGNDLYRPHAAPSMSVRSYQVSRAMKHGSPDRMALGRGGRRPMFVR